MRFCLMKRFDVLVVGTGSVRAMHIHPAMPEVVQQAFGNLKPA